MFLFLKVDTLFKIITKLKVQILATKQMVKFEDISYGGGISTYSWQYQGIKYSKIQ